MHRLDSGGGTGNIPQTAPLADVPLFGAAAPPSAPRLALTQQPGGSARSGSAGQCPNAASASHNPVLTGDRHLRQMDRGVLGYAGRDTSRIKCPNMNPRSVTILRNRNRVPATSRPTNV